MAKTKTAWFCSECGYESPKWLGRCPGCNAWNTLTEEPLQKDTGVQVPWAAPGSGTNKPFRLHTIPTAAESRLALGNAEFDRLLGGGLVEGSLVLLAGEPGIGKSTLSLQLPLRRSDIHTLYVSGEESAKQIKMRADRLLPQGQAAAEPHGLQVLCETLLENILQQAAQVKPRLLIIDSIQTLYSQALSASPGSVSQVRECAARLLQFAKETGTTTLLVGHITKEGSIAGPKVLEHIVDVVLQFEGDSRHAYRILRSVKNRFGSTAELAIFEMCAGGLREVENPSEVFIPLHEEGLSGIAIASMIDGTRPFLIETQALVGTAAYGMPQRSATGYDVRRMNMLLAILEKRAGFKLASKDVFLNIAGGIRVSDPAVDLAVALSVLSSAFDIALHSRWCFAAELGLSGEIRPVAQLDRRLAEAARLGFKRMYISGYNRGYARPKGLEIIEVNNITQLLPLLK